MPNTSEDNEIYLKKHFQEEIKQNINQPKFQPTKVSSDNIKISEVDYTIYNAAELPCGILYPNNTMIMVKAATTKSIQKFSTMNERDFLSMLEGINDMLIECVKIKYADGTIGSALGIKDMDKLYVLYLIRNLTPLSKRFLITKKECSCKTINEIEHINVNFVYHKISEKMMKKFDRNNRNFVFDYNGNTYSLTCPNIGLTKNIYKYLSEQINNKKETNLAFIKIIPYLLGFKNSMSDQEIKVQLEKFESKEMSAETFNFLNSAVNRIVFGVEGLRKKCSNPDCDLDVYVDTIDAFPKKLSDIFLDDDVFEDYLNEQ